MSDDTQRGHASYDSRAMLDGEQLRQRAQADAVYAADVELHAKVTREIRRNIESAENVPYGLLATRLLLLVDRHRRG